MSNSLSVSISDRVIIRLKSDSGLSDTNSLSYRAKMTNGTGTGEANQKHVDSRTLAPSASHTYTLDDNSLSDGLGGTVSMTRLKEIWLENTSDDARASIEISFWSGDEYESISSQGVVQNGGLFHVADPNAGWRIVPSTHDHVVVTNLSSAVSASYDIGLVGVSA